jgi:hypothetical protein
MGFEDLYDVPPTEVDLVGGPHDGKRFLVPDDRDTWLMPNDSPPLTPGEIMDVAFGFAPLRSPLDGATVYCFTGRITDDGRRIFQAS